MSTSPIPLPAPLPPPPPGAQLRAQLTALADDLAHAGQEPFARALRAATEAWWAEEETWRQGVVNVLRLHHDINNALVGVRGNTQLLLMAPVAEQPGVRERLEVVLRESSRIKDAAHRISELKASLGGPGPVARAA
jgi:nitrogen-specific signal transduction histidine kinase